MTKKSSQELLNEILLHMRYDSSLTLSENKEMLMEQGGNYYTPSGDLIGYPGVNNVNIPASSVYPEIKNGKYPQKADTNKLTPLLLSRGIVNASKNQENKIKSLIGEPPPVKPVKPIQSSKLCPEIYDPSKSYSVPFYYKNKCYRGITGKQDSLSQYNIDLSNYNKQLELWNKANPKINAVGNANQIAQQYIQDKNKWRNDVAQQRDAFAGYADDNDRKTAASIVIQELEKVGYDWKTATKQNNPSLLWKSFLGFRDVWNHWGTQVVTASIAAAPETLGISTLAALVLDIGVDAFIFFVDLIDCFDNPDSDESWTRLAEDLTTLVLFGSFTGLGQLLKSQVGKTGVKTFRNAIQPIWVQIKPMIQQFIQFMQNKLKSAGLPSSVLSWVNSKTKRMLQWIDNFTISKVGAQVAPLITRVLPMVSAFFVLIKLNESGISEALEPLVTKAVGIPVQTLRLIAQGQKTPTNEEKQKLSKVVLPKEVISHFEKEEVKQDLISKQTKNYGDMIQTVREDTKQLAQQNQKEYLVQLISYMKGSCKDYFNTLLSKNKLELVVTAENGSVFTSYRIDGQESGYYISDITSDPTVVLNSNLNPIDCENLNKTEKT